MEQNSLPTNKGRVGTLLCRALMIASPFILLAAISLLTGRNAFAAYPVWSDELDMWRSLYSWQSVGFAKGYSGLHEAIPTIGTLGVTGVTPLMLYGGFVKLFGLSQSTILLANAVWISLAALVFCLLIKPSNFVSLMFSALIALYLPIVMYSATSMTELFNYALMLFYIAFLTRYYRKRGIAMLIMCFVALAVGCVYRAVYALLIIPTVLVYGDMKLGLKSVIGAACSLAIIALCYYLATLVTAPSLYKFTYHFLNAESVGDMLRVLLSHGKANLIDYLKDAGSPMQNYFRLTYAGVSLLCLLGSLVGISREDGKARLRFRFDAEVFCCFGLLLAAQVFVIAFYETNDWVDFRLLAPFLWFTLGFLTLRRKPLIPVATLCASLIAVFLLFTSSPEGALSDEYRFVPEPENPAIAAAAQVITYDEDAKNPFTNTVRTDICSYEVQRELNPGLGLQYGWFTTDTTGKSNWILTDHLKCVVEGYELVYKEPGVNVYKLINGCEVD